MQPRHNPVWIKRSAASQHRRGEEGFVLLAVLFMLLLVTLSLAVAAPKMAVELQREKETETIHRGMQYARAIRMYYRKFGRYPTSINELIKSDNEHFLRRRYLDPLTGKDDWRLIYLGQAQTMGQPAEGSSATGANAAAGPGNAATANPGAPGSAGSSGASNSGFSLGSSNSTAPGSSGFSLGSSGGTSGSSAASGNPATGSTTGSSGGISSFGGFGEHLSGGPIVGVGLPVDKPSLKVFRKKSRYNQWEFVYDPTQDLGGAMGQTGAGIEQQSGAANGVNGTNGANNGFGGNTSNEPGGGGFSLGNSSFGNSNSPLGSFGSSNQDASGGSPGSNNNSSTPSATPPSGAGGPIR